MNIYCETNISSEMKADGVNGKKEFFLILCILKMQSIVNFKL